MSRRGSHPDCKITETSCSKCGFSNEDKEIPHECEERLRYLKSVNVSIKRLPNNVCSNDASIHICHICDEMFINEDTCKHHYLTHQKSKLFDPKIILEPPALDVESLMTLLPDKSSGILLLNKEKNSQFKYQCVKCLKTFNRAYSAAYHSAKCDETLQENLNNKYFAFFCSVCYTVESTIKLLTEHKKNCAELMSKSLIPRYSGPPIHFCTKCGYKLKYGRSPVSFFYNHDCQRMYSYITSAHVKLERLPKSFRTNCIYPCHFCNKYYFTVDCIRHHHLLKHPTKPENEPDWDSLRLHN